MYVALTMLVVGGGLALGAAPVLGRHALPWVRWAAVLSALAIIVFVLLPTAAVALGIWTIAVVALGLFVPLLLERLLHREHVAEQGALAGLVVHQAVDGAQIAWLGPDLGVGLALSIAVHGATLSAAAMVAATAVGRRAMTITAGLLLGATALGGVVGTVATGFDLEPVEPWLRAAVSGLLLHAMLHAVGHVDQADARA